ncbi:hypothetical protein C8R44DRAFT_739406 [Mycena epipterygia]|nr:hypothetical protein C8R44DRAFT_739406 [Mycena epipterygia]
MCSTITDVCQSSKKDPGVKDSGLHCKFELRMGIYRSEQSKNGIKGSRAAAPLEHVREGRRGVSVGLIKKETRYMTRNLPSTRRPARGTFKIESKLGEHHWWLRLRGELRKQEIGSEAEGFRLEIEEARYEGHVPWLAGLIAQLARLMQDAMACSRGLQRSKKKLRAALRAGGEDGAALESFGSLRGMQKQRVIKARGFELKMRI